MPPCRVAGCVKPAHAHELCIAHYRRHTKGKPLDAPVREARSPWARLTDQALRYADADSEDDEAYRRAAAALAQAALSWAKRQDDG